MDSTRKRSKIHMRAKVVGPTPSSLASFLNFSHSADGRRTGTTLSKGLLTSKWKQPSNRLRPYEPRQVKYNAH